MVCKALVRLNASVDAVVTTNPIHVLLPWSKNGRIVDTVGDLYHPPIYYLPPELQKPRANISALRDAILWSLQ